MAFTHVYWIEYQGQYYWTAAYLEYRALNNSYLTRLSNQGEDWEPDWQTTDIVPPASQSSVVV